VAAAAARRQKQRASWSFASRQGPCTVIEPEREGSIHSTKGRIMVKAVVLYGPPEDPDAFKRSDVPPRF
jgi:hypothetical protein